MVIVDSPYLPIVEEKRYTSGHIHSGLVAANIGSNVFLEKIEMVTTDLLGDKPCNPVLELAVYAQIIHPPGKPFHSHHAEHVGNPRSRR